MTTPALEDIRAALTVPEVLAYAHIEVTERGRGDLFGQQCPREYHRQSPRAFVINPSTGMWICYACPPEHGKPLAGDLLSLIAERERLSIQNDFPRVLSIAAEIAGVSTTSPDELAQRRRDRQVAEQARRIARAEDEQRWHALSIEHATQHWNALNMTNQSALQYLAERGVSQAVSLGLVRSDHTDHGSIAVPLYDAGGQIANVIRRRLPSRAPSPDDRFRPLTLSDGERHRGLWARGTYVNPVSDVVAGRDVVLTEGFFDGITAAIAFAPALVIGARSATDLPAIARAVAAQIKHHGDRLLVNAHQDDAGFGGALAACREAHTAGLRLFRGDLVLVDCEAPDLNDAWRAGWRPSPRSVM